MSVTLTGWDRFPCIVKSMRLKRRTEQVNCLRKSENLTCSWYVRQSQVEHTTPFPVFQQAFSPSWDEQRRSLITTVERLIFADWLPPDKASSWSCLSLLSEVYRCIHQEERGFSIPRLRLCPSHEDDIVIELPTSLCAYYVLCNRRDATGNVPHKGDQFAGNSNHNYLGWFSSCS